MCRKVFFASRVRSAICLREQFARVRFRPIADIREPCETAAVGRELPKWLMPILIATVGGALLWQVLRPEPRTLLSCAFIQRPGGAPIKTNDGKALAGRLWLQGSLVRNTQDGMYRFEGMTSAGGGNAWTSGNVWLDKKGGVEGMALYASPADFGSEELRIATLNDDGRLDPDPLTAYLFIDPPEKLLHPADYVCSVTDR